MLIVLERECLDFGKAIENLSEQQELLATLMKEKRSLQKVALERFQVKPAQSSCASCAAMQNLCSRANSH